MPHRPLANLVALALLSLSAARAQAPAVPAAPPAPPWQGKLSPCPLPGVPGAAFCGTYEVFEDREARAGRKIPLKIVLLPATGPDRAPDPIFFLAGGPGQGETPDAAKPGIPFVPGTAVCWRLGRRSATVSEAVVNREWRRGA